MVVAIAWRAIEAMGHKETAEQTCGVIPTNHASSARPLLRDLSEHVWIVEPDINEPRKEVVQWWCTT